MNKKWITLLFSFSLCFCMSCSDSESDKKEEGKVEEEKPVTVLSKTVPLADPYILVHDSLYYIYGTNVGTGFRLLLQRPRILGTCLGFVA